MSAQMMISIFGEETQAQPVIPVSFRFQWNLDYPGAFVKVEFSPESGAIGKIFYFDHGTENDMAFDTPETISAFCEKYPKTAKAVCETISRLRSLGE